MRKKMPSYSGLGGRSLPGKGSVPSGLSGEPFALLAAFRALSANDIYTMAPKEAVVRGYDYARQQRVQQYLWNEARTTLVARVQGTRLYAVTFSCPEGFLEASCDCPAWDPRWLCKHVLCACFTTKHLLSPESFRMPDWQPGRAEPLRIELFGDVPEPREGPRQAPAGSVRTESVRAEPRYEIVLDIRQGYPQIGIYRNGAPLAAGWAPLLPPELVPLFNASRFLSGYGEDPLRRYLRIREQRYPVVLMFGQGAMTLDWCPSVKCRSKTEIDLAGGLVRIRALCLADGVPLERPARVGSFVVDLAGGRLFSLEDERGWAPYRSLRRCFLELDPFADTMENEPSRAVLLPGDPWAGRWTGSSREMEFTLSPEAFLAAQVDLPQGQAGRILRDLLLKVEGAEAPVQRADAAAGMEPASCAVILRPPSGAGGGSPPAWTLQLHSRQGAARCAPSLSVFGGFSALEQGRAVSGALRAHKRKAVLYEAFFQLRAVRAAKERGQRIKTVLALEGWTRAVSDEGAQWLRGQLAAYGRPDVRLRIRDGRWALQPIDKARESLLYSIPFEIFGPEAFRGMRRSDELTIEALALFRHLPELLERLTAAGIELLYEDQPLRTAQWDCAVQVERGERDGTGIDWFEIRPEIRCDGVALSEAEWRAALLQGGLIAGEQGLRVLDRQTVERLRAILDLTGEGPPGREASKIVRVPRLQMLDWLALREQGIAVTLPAEDEAVLARLLGFTKIAAKPLPKDLQATLRPYQREGYAWLAFLYEHRFGACLADDMGLGKTLQAICLLAAIQEGRIKGARGVPGPHLVVVPTSLLFNWEQELARFAPGLTVHSYSGSERTLEAKDGEVVLTTYGLVRRDIGQLERLPFHVIVFDEAQAVKNILADTTSAVRRLRGRFTLALSGTPIENHLGEYFSVIDLCLPGLLGDYDRFKPHVKRAEGAALDRLLRRTRPFILRRTKAEILHDLPPKIESEVFLDLTDRQKALYQQTVAQVRSTIDEAYATKTAGQAQFIALTAILKLRQVCLSPRLLTKQDGEASPKLHFLVERLQVLLEEGHSALVFSQFTSFLDLVQEACVRHELPYQRLDGSTAAAARKDRVAAFQSGERPGVFLLSLKAGGQGLNLTKATYVFLLDPWWNPAVENQASDRAHRIGQQRTVSIVRVLMRHSIEEKMMALKQRKLALYDAVMAGAVRGSGQGVLTKADFEFLLAPGGG